MKKKLAVGQAAVPNAPAWRDDGNGQHPMLIIIEAGPAGDWTGAGSGHQGRRHPPANKQPRN